VTRADVSASIEAIDALLPQTQCTHCGYAGCRPYAEAVATGRADINQCPPGGEDVIRDLAALLGVPFKPLNPRFGVTKVPAVAVIDEEACIGCTLCIQVCPVDAIVGAAKVMHTVIEQQCTGCELCIPPCPVDCIDMRESAREFTRREKQVAAAEARRRFKFRNLRLQRDNSERLAKRASPAKTGGADRKRVTIAKAIARARMRLRNSGR